MRNFLEIKDLSIEDINNIVNIAIKEKKALKANKPQYSTALAGKILAMVFQKPSTRTRVSFDVAMRQLGGGTIVLNGSEMQLGHGETISDTAKVLSRFCNAIMLRCHEEEDMQALAQNASVPVVNALTKESHPCQILAAMMTFIEHGKDIKTSKMAWLGDFNNVTNSYIELAEKLGFSFYVSTPELTEKQQHKLRGAQQNNIHIIYEKNPTKATQNADIIITDTWVSMGDNTKDKKAFMPYQVNTNLTMHAKSDYLFSHCLPAHRGEEVTNKIIDGNNSIVFDEAENRLHVQKAILLYMFGII